MYKASETQGKFVHLTLILSGIKLFYVSCSETIQCQGLHIPTRTYRHGRYVVSSTADIVDKMSFTITEVHATLDATRLAPAKQAHLQDSSNHQPNLNQVLIAATAA